MSRIAASVFLVNTFLPLLLVGALTWAGWQSYRAYADLLSAPIEALEAKLSDVQKELETARGKIEDTQEVLAEKGREVGQALDAAAEPFEAVGTAVDAVANASIPVPKPQLRFDYIRDKKGKPKKVLWFTPRVPKINFDGKGFSIGLPKPVKTAFSKLGDGFSKLIGFTTPIGEMVDEIQKLGPSLEPLQARVAELETALAEAREKAAQAMTALKPVLNVLKWLTYVLGPWLALSYVCWVWLRLRMWRRIMVGTD